MSKEFHDVARFNTQVIKLEPVEYLNAERLQWFNNVVEEEFSEFREATNNYLQGRIDKASEDELLKRKVDMYDAIIDLIYFAYGRLFELGLSEDEFEVMWDAVQKANMSKVRGNKGRGSDTDAIKPTGWKGPEDTLISYINEKRNGYTVEVTHEDVEDEKVTEALSSLKANLMNELTEEQTKVYDRVIGKYTSLDNTTRELEQQVPKNSAVYTQLHLPGVKFDDGKPNLALVFKGFAKALLDVGYIGTFGAKKYTPNGWLDVPNATERYSSALLRHLFATFRDEYIDPESGRLHYAHIAWNALALYELHFNKLPLNTYETYKENAAKLEKEFFEAQDGNNG